MSDKERDRNEDQEDESLEKKKFQVSLVGILIGVLGLFSLLQSAAIVYLLAADNGDPRTEQHATQLERLEFKVTEIEKITASAQAYNQHAKVLEERLEKVLEKTDLNNYAEVRALIMHQEAGYQAFITALQKGMYELSRMVKGSRTWYEVYKEELDRIVAASQERLELLNSLTPDQPQLRRLAQ